MCASMDAQNSVNVSQNPASTSRPKPPMKNSSSTPGAVSAKPRCHLCSATLPSLSGTPTKKSSAVPATSSEPVHFSIRNFPAASALATPCKPSASFQKYLTNSTSTS